MAVLLGFAEDVAMSVKVRLKWPRGGPASVLRIVVDLEGLYIQAPRIRTISST